MLNMGKLVPKNVKKEEINFNDYNNLNERYRPSLLHSETYLMLTDSVLSLMPTVRNVFLTMNEYDLSEINPTHPKTADSPTHIIIFCIRFVAEDIFQPIGGLLTYKCTDQSVLLAECVKAYINDLYNLGVYVVGTVSPPFKIFKAILSHLVNIENFDTHAGAITYAVPPFRQLVHVYDVQYLLMNLQNQFKESDIKYSEISSKGKRELRATWTDILIVLNISAEFKILTSYLRQNKSLARRVHIFSRQIFEQLLESEALGLLSKYANGSSVLFDAIRSYLQFTELDMVDLNIMNEMDNWENLTVILETMTFQKPFSKTSNKYRDIEPLVKDFEENFLLRDDAIETESNIDTNSKRSSLNDDNPIIPKIKRKKNKKKRRSINEQSFINWEQNDDCVDQISHLESVSDKIHKRKPYDKPVSIKNQSLNDNSNSIRDLKDLISTQYEKKKTDVSHSNVNNVKKHRSKTALVNNDPNCDIDKNNNSDESVQGVNGNVIKKVREEKLKSKKKKHKKRNDDYDLVINDPKEFFNSIEDCNRDCNRLNFEESKSEPEHNLLTQEANTNASLFPNFPTDSSELNKTQKKNKSNFFKELYKLPSHLDGLFYSQSDEELETDITETCDKIPNIIELLNNVPVKDLPTPNASEEFEGNVVSRDLLSTVLGTKLLIEKLVKKRVKVAKPDAFIVEHIDFLVHVIKRDKNHVNPVYYYGQSYGFLNANVAFSTLKNNKGLRLVSK